MGFPSGTIGLAESDIIGLLQDIQQKSRECFNLARFPAFDHCQFYTNLADCFLGVSLC